MPIIYILCLSSQAFHIIMKNSGVKLIGFTQGLHKVVQLLFLIPFFHCTQQYVLSLLMNYANVFFHQPKIVEY